MQQLYEITDKIVNGEMTEIREEIKIKDGAGALINVQIKDYLSSEDYFKYMGLTPEQNVDINNPTARSISTKFIVKSKPSQFFLILAMVINPKLDDKKLNEMDYKMQQKLYLAVQRFCFPPDEKDEPFTDASEPQTGP